MLKAELQKALEQVKPGLANKELIEQSTSFAFMGDKVVTYNDEISISHPIEGMELTGAVKAEELYQLISKLQQEDFEMQINEGELVVQSGKAKAGLTLESKIVLPLADLSSIGEWKPLPSDITEAMKFVLPAASSDMSKPIFTCIHIRGDGMVEATDNLRVTRFKTKGACSDSCLIPASVAQVLAKYPIIEIAEGTGWNHFRTKEATIFSCRIFEGVFPDVDASGIMDVKGETLELPKGLSDILDRARVFAKRDFALDSEVLISIRDKKIIVKGQSEYGWFEEEANIRYNNAPITFYIHPDFLKEMLSATTACVVGESSIKFTGENWEHVIWLKGGE